MISLVLKDILWLLYASKLSIITYKYMLSNIDMKQNEKNQPGEANMCYIPEIQTEIIIYFRTPNQSYDLIS